MAFSTARRDPLCPACAGPTRASALCRECAEAFAVARRAHPAVARAIALPHDGLSDGVGTALWGVAARVDDDGDLPLRCFLD